MTQEEKLELINALEDTIGEEGIKNLYNKFVYNKEFIKNKELITEKPVELEAEKTKTEDIPPIEELERKTELPPVMASIYAIDALPLVEEDLLNREKELNNRNINKEEDNEIEIINKEEKNNELIKELKEEIIDVYKKEDKEPVEEPFDKAPVLERKLTNNNPWSGIETVAPGTLKL